MDHLSIFKIVNPLQLLVGNLFGRNLMLIKLKAAAIPAGTPVTECMDYFGRTLPAGTTYLLFTEVEGNLSECPGASCSMLETTAFRVKEGSESRTVPVTAERTAAAGGVF